MLLGTLGASLSKKLLSGQGRKEAAEVVMKACRDVL